MYIFLESSKEVLINDNISLPMGCRKIMHYADIGSALQTTIDIQLIQEQFCPCGEYSCKIIVFCLPACCHKGTAELLIQLSQKTRRKELE